MNVAMISFRLPAPGLQRGGCERVAHDLANGLAQRGHHVTVWSADPRPRDANYEVARIAGSSFIHHWLGFRLVSGYIGNFLAITPRYNDAHVIIAHGDSLLLPLRGIPVLRIMHGSALDEARTARTLFRKGLQFGVYLQELITVHTQTTVGISRNTHRRYRALQEIIPNGVDANRFYPDNAAKTSQPSILFVGKLGGRKRGQLLIDWFAKFIRPALPEATLWMVSEPGDPTAGVHYFSGLSDTDLAALYRSASVYASPSCYEGFGLPYLEAMASGTPVIASANPGSREVTADGQYGLLIEDDDRFAAEILHLLRSPEQREIWSNRGLTRSRELSLDRALDRYEAMLDILAPAQRYAEVGI